jgi:hypothetical protein
MHRTEGANNIAGLYTAGPPPTTITADALNSIQEELATVIEYSGQQVQTAATDTQNQLLAAVLSLIPTYDAIVTSQASWDDVIERTAANTYQFKDAYQSIFVKVGDYSLTLSGGDTWGNIQTNNVSHLVFEQGATIHFANLPGYLEVNTTGSYLQNVTVRGTGTVAAAITSSFLLNANHVTFSNCKTHTRLSNVDFYGFQGSGTALHNKTSKYENCSSYTLDGADKIGGFYLCQNLNDCVSYDLSSSADFCSGFSSCSRLSSCNVYQIDSVSAAFGYLSCLGASSCTAEDIDSSGSTAYGFNLCKRISGCHATDVQAVANSNTYGFANCNEISACTTIAIDATGTGIAYGYYTCTSVSGC